MNQAHTPTPPRASVFDIEELTNLFDDRVFALEIAGHFASIVPEYRAELKACLTQQNVKQTLCLVHRLKESAATVKAGRIANIASEIESSAQDNQNQLERIQKQLSKLLSEFDSFVNALQDEKAGC